MAALTAGSYLLLTKSDPQVLMLTALVLFELAEKETDLLNFILESRSSAHLQSDGQHPLFKTALMFDVMWQLPKGELFSTFLISADCCFLFCVGWHSQSSYTCKEEESKICSLLTRLILSEFRRRASVFSCICWMPVYKKNICGRLKKNCCLIDVWSWGVNWIHELDRDVYLLMITHQIRKRQHTDR